MKKLHFIVALFLACACVTGCSPSSSDKTDDDRKKQPGGSYKTAFLGDSLTDKGVYSDIVTTHYTDYLYDNCSFISSIQNVGYAGSCIAGLPGKQGVNPSFVQRYTQIAANADLIVVLGGTNDFGYGSPNLSNPLGEYGDSSQETFYGALKVLIDGFGENYPEAKVVFVTPLYRKEQESNGIPNKNKYGFTLADYVNAIRYTCDQRNVACFDAFNEITEIDAFTYTEYEVDGLHLNNEGNVLLGKYLAEKLTAMLD